MSHLGYHNCSPNAAASVEALIATYTTRMQEFRAYEARVDGAALCTQMLRDLELLRHTVAAAATTVALPAAPAASPQGDSESFQSERQQPAAGSTAARVSPPSPAINTVDAPSPAVSTRPNLAIHRERTAAALRSVETPRCDGYDPSADARSIAAQLRRGGSQ